MSDRGSTPGMAANRGVLSYTGQAIGQLGDRKILLVLIKSTLLSGAALVALLMVLGFFWPDANLFEGWFDLFFGAEAAGGGENADTPPTDPDASGSDEIGWREGFLAGVSSFLYWAAVVAAFYFLFPILLTLVISVFLDDIIDAVEEKYYPDRLATRKVGIMEGLQSAISLSVKLLLIHLILLIPYLVLFILSSGVLTLVLFTVVNAWAYGQEYFEMTAGRHFNRASVLRLYKERKGDIFPGGVVIALLFLVPFVNIVASVLGVAIMTHQVHGLLDEAP